MIAKLFSRLIVFAIALLLSAPAQAAWYEASSDHFVIYANDSEKDLRRFAENLERYHTAMEIVTGRRVEKPSPSNRVVIFAVGSGGKLRKVAGGKSRYIAGFYLPRAGASRAYVQDIRNRNGNYPHFSTVVLLHEYAHHFLISTSRFAMPRWMSEGAAEFFASTIFDRDGSIQIGLPALHRAGELFHADSVSIRELLDHELYERNRGRGYDAFYGRSWLLYHYLMLSQERSGQLSEYWLQVLNGADSVEAAESVFGDLDELDDQLEDYLEDRKMHSFKIDAKNLPIGEVSLRRLPKGEAEMMDVRIRSQRGVTAELAEELVVKARKIAAKYPQDPGVLTALAEAEYDAGNLDKAIAAADAAIALDPGRANAYVQKGYALFRKAKDSPVPDQAYDEAMKPFAQLNARENDHPLPLIYYYRSYAERGTEPPENAKKALERAAQLAPFDQQLWLNVAIMQASEGKIALAQNSLRPLASDPHGGRQAGLAQKMIEILTQAPEGEPLRVNPRIAEANDADDTGEEADEAPGGTPTGEGDGADSADET